MPEKQQENTQQESALHPPQVPRKPHGNLQQTRQADVAALNMPGPAEASGRDGDYLTGRPPQRPNKEPATVPEADLAAVAENDEALPEQIFSDSHIKLPGFWFETTFLMAVITLGGIVGLLLYSQAFQVIRSLDELSAYPRAAGYGLLTLLVGVVVLGIARFAAVYFKIKKGRQIILRQVQLLAESTALSDDAYRKARHLLRDYVEDYTLEGPVDRQLAVLGIGKTQLENLRQAREWLLRDRNIQSQSWLKEFDTRFQSVLDRAAAERVSRYALLVGVKTAVSPYGLLDMLATLYNNFMLFTDLTKIYNKRLGRLETLYVLGWIFINTYVAGELQQPAEEAFDDIAETIMSGCPSTVRKLGGKITEGTANYVLTLRLGRKSMNLLRPMKG